MKILFLGNGPFAVPALRALVDAGHSIPLVVCRPDRPQGKHQRVSPGPVARAALELKLPLLQPENVNDAAFVQRLRGYGGELLVVADFGQILSNDCLQVCPHGGINIHGSLLPKYRGAAPIVWAIYQGETVTGVSIIQMTAGLDAGGVIVRREVPIGPEQTAEELEPLLALEGARAAVDAVRLIESGTTQPVLQDPALVTKAPRVRKEDGLIDWQRSAQQIHDHVRAMRPWPLAYTFWHRPKGEPLRLQILRTSVRHDHAANRAGEILALQDGIEVGTGDGILVIHELKPAGKGSLASAAFLRGHSMAPGQKFGDFTN